MIEHGGGIEQHLKDHHCYYGWTQYHDSGEFDQHGENDLECVESCPGGYVVVEFGVMHSVQAPENGYGVDHHMLQVDHEIHRHHCYDD